MHLFKRKFTINLLIFLISFNYLFDQTYPLESRDVAYAYEDYDNNKYYEDYSVKANKTTSKSNDDKYDYDTEEENSCTLESLWSSAKTFLPDDYEQGKNMTIKMETEHVNETLAIFRRLNQIVKNITGKLEPTMKRYATQMMSDIYTLDVSNDCLNTLIYLLTNGQFYGLRFIDSMGGIPGGLTEGARGSFGEYDQCLDIKSPNDLSPAFTGQYCILKTIMPVPPPEKFKVDDPYDTYIDDSFEPLFKIPGATDTLTITVKKGLPRFKAFTKLLMDLLVFEKNALFRLGLCLPSTCNAKDVENIINKYTYPLIHLPIQVGPDCDFKGKPLSVNKYQWISAIAFLVMIGLTILSTLYEIAFCRGHKPSPNANLFCSFSIIANTKTLWGPAPSLSCIDGLRVLFLFWIIFIHTYVFRLVDNQIFKRYTHGGNGLRFMGEPNYVLHRNLFIIDFFFLISGTLTTYIMVSKLEKSGGKFNYIQYALFRYLRMTPGIMFSIFVIWLTPFVMNGPVAIEVWNKFYDSCVDGWTTTIFYYQNYRSGFPEPFMCNPTSWSIAAEYHMYIIAPIFFLTLYWKPKIGLILLATSIVVTSITNIVPLYFGIVHYYDWQKWTSGKDAEYSIKYHFFGTNAHMSPYFVGLLFGYILRKYPSVKLSKITETLLWITTISMTVFSNYWCSDFFVEPPGNINMHLFLIFGKLFWCAGWCWLVYACYTGRAKNINTFLSASVFKPWSRLSLGFGLLHTMPIMYRYSTWRYVLPLEDYYMVTGIVFDFLLTFILSYVLYILVECPVGNLMQIFLVPQPRESKQKPFDSNGYVINLKDECTKL